MERLLVLAAAACVAGFVACDSDSPGNPPVLSPLDAGSETPGDGGSSTSTTDAGATIGCSNIVNPNPSAADVDELAKAIDLWTWSKEVRGTTSTNLDACDSTVAYRIGPIVFIQGNAHDYARCALMQNGVVEVGAGALNRPTSCGAFSCSPTKLGLVWSSGSGSVYTLDGAGKPTGSAVFHVRFVGGTLLWTGIGGSSNGYSMENHPGNQSNLGCP